MRRIRRSTALLSAFIAILTPTIAAPQGGFDPVGWLQEQLPARSFTLSSASMAPTLNEGDYIRVDQTTAARGGIRRGDIVAFKTNNGTTFVKRVIALPGETIAFIDGVPAINGVMLRQTIVGPYALDPPKIGVGRFEVLTELEETGPEGGTWRVLDWDQPSRFDNMGTMLVPDGAYFVVGDFRDNSLDSRAFDGPAALGFIDADRILGVVTAIAPPPPPIAE